jgi:hypothetical protein
MKNCFLLFSFALICSVAGSPANAQWKPKRSWVSDLSPKDAKRLMGALNPPSGQAEMSGFSDPSLPASLDWRNRNGINWTPPIMNQGNCGSCVAFASMATFESQMMISSGLPWLHPTYSAQALFFCGGGSCDTGWFPEYGAGALKAHGAPDESCMPYTAGSTGADVSCAARCADSDSRTVKIRDLKKITGGVEAVKAALQHGPVTAPMTAYADFDTYGSGIYKHLSGNRVGGHAVSIIGYDNAKQAWLVQNSWGTEWGENGYAWISWADTSGVATVVWSLDVAPIAPAISIVSPTDRQFVNGVVTLQAQSTAPANASLDGSVTFFLKSVNEAEASQEFKVECASSVPGASVGPNYCQVNADFSKLPEGRYEITAVGKTNSVRSQVREFYVQNSIPKMAIRFSGADGVDLHKALSGRPEFNVSADFPSVPMAQVEFRAEDASGKIVFRRMYNQVLHRMKFGFNTATVPNGTDTIYFHGETPFKGQVYSVDSARVKVLIKN